MATRVGYRALIVDDERPAYQLSQFLLRPDLNGKVIQSFFISDNLSAAYGPAENSDFIYIDPFSFGLAEAIRFIAEVQTRSPVKAFTLFRSGRQWQERQRDLEGLALLPARLRTMLTLDKDVMGDPAFAQVVRNNIASMEREFQQELQRTGFDPARSGFQSGFQDLGVPRVGMGGDPGMTRTGTWYNVPDYAQPRPTGGLPDYGAQPPFGTLNAGQLTPLQLQAMLDQAAAAAVAATRTVSPNPTHPLGAPPQTTPMLPAPDLGQYQQNLATLQQSLNGLQNALVSVQSAQGKVQEQSAATQRELRDYSRAASGVEQRVHDLETRLPRLDQTGTRLQTSQRLVLIMALVALALGLAGTVLGLLAYLHK